MRPYALIGPSLTACLYCAMAVRALADGGCAEETQVMDETVGLSITVTEDQLGSTEEIARSIGAKGLRVDRVVPEVGAIHAIGKTSDIEPLRQMDGILDVAAERDVIQPPVRRSIPQ